MKTVKELTQHVPQVGRLDAIGLASGRRAAIEGVERARAEVGTGLVGDHHARGGGDRQVTLIQAEHLAVVGALLGRDPVPFELARRNLVVSGINLLALKSQRFRIGEVLLEGSGPCAPCSRMEENLGDGGYAAMRGHGGITARVVVAGELVVGAEVRALRTD